MTSSWRLGSFETLPKSAAAIHRLLSDFSRHTQLLAMALEYLVLVGFKLPTVVSRNWTVWELTSELVQTPQATSDRNPVHRFKQESKFMGSLSCMALNRVMMFYYHHQKHFLKCFQTVFPNGWSGTAKSLYFTCLSISFQKELLGCSGAAWYHSACLSHVGTCVPSPTTHALNRTISQYFSESLRFLARIIRQPHQKKVDCTVLVICILK